MSVWCCVKFGLRPTTSSTKSCGAKRKWGQDITNGTPPTQLVKFSNPAFKQFPGGVQNPSLSGLTVWFAKKYSSGENPNTSMLSSKVADPL